MYAAERNFAEVHSDNSFLLQLDSSQNYNEQPCVQINVNKKNKFQVLVDTGASLSFINELNVPEGTEIFRYDGKGINDLTGSIAAIGYIKCNIQITKNINYFHKLIVISKQHKMPKSIIIGVDFLTECKGKIDFEQKILIGLLKGIKWIKTLVKFDAVCENDEILATNVADDEIMFHVDREITLPPLSHQIVEGKCKIGEGQGIVSKNFSPNESVFVAEALVHIKDNRAPILMLNTAQHEVVINAGSVIAKGERNNEKVVVPLQNESVCSIFENAEKDDAADKVKKEENFSMDDLKDLMDEEYKKDMLPLSNEFRDVIAKKGESLGKTDLLQAEINTGDHPPIFTQQYPFPHKAKAEAAALVNEMLEENVIRERDHRGTSC